MAALAPMFDVVIVGFGPVGAVAANLLGKLGLRVKVLERSRHVHDLPRAIHFDGEVMRIFQAIGLADEMLAVTSPVVGVDFLSANGSPAFRARPPPRSPSSGWAHGYTFYQPDLEKVLRAGVDRFPGVEVETGFEVEQVEAAEATVSMRRVDGGSLQKLTARFVLGCDGARSTVRKSMAVDLDDLRADQPWLVVDAMLKRDVASLAPVLEQIGDPERPAAYVPSTGRHRRWELMLLDGESADEMERPERVRQLLRRWVSEQDVDVVRAVVYAFHALVARQWRKGSAFLLGDAAHQMPPFLGQGMCAGIWDAANLCWKLAANIRGEATEALLDTYGSEREPHVRALIQRAVDAGKFLQTTGAEAARARDRILREDPAAMKRMGIGRPMPSLGGTWTRPAGEPLPQSLIGDDAALGEGFALVTQTEISRAPWKVIHVRRSDGFPSCALVRPDRYVLAAGDAGSLPALVEAFRRYMRGHD
jgi:3-(3-hydroxy-phenyl)propionate hydroxylase